MWRLLAAVAAAAVCRGQQVDDDEALIDLAEQTCKTEFAAFDLCRFGDDDVLFGNTTTTVQRQLEFVPNATSVGKADLQCEDLQKALEGGATPCHDGLYDDEDNGSELELFAAYSCYYTVVCGFPFECEPFQPGLIYDEPEHNDTSLQVPKDYVGPTTFVTFYHAFPTYDYNVCFTFGPSQAARHARTAGPIGYGQVLHAEFEATEIYFNIHTVAASNGSTTRSCSDDSRVRVTPSTLHVDAHATPTNFIGWGSNVQGIASVDLWRWSLRSDNVNETVIANEAIGYGQCQFTWDPVGPAINQGAFLGVDQATLVDVRDSYANVDKLKVLCTTGATASINLTASKLCGDESPKKILAVGDNSNGFPLHLMLVHGLPCGADDHPSFADPPSVPQNDGESNSKKRSSASFQLALWLTVVGVVFLLGLGLSLLAYRAGCNITLPNAAAAHELELASSSSNIPTTTAKVQEVV